MPGDNSFLVEEFIDAVTSQLDRVQDALRLKALNRPLTYALKDFALDLNVFVDLDDQGSVRFRPSGVNESGSSTVRLGFTTITKPMIDENTIPLAMTRSPSLDELGLTQVERRSLERLGVRTAAQLNQLQASTGTTAASRLSGVPIDRLRQALQLGRPRVRDVAPVQPPAKPPVEPPAQKPPITQPPLIKPGQIRPDLVRPVRPGAFIPRDVTGVVAQPDQPVVARPPRPDGIRAVQPDANTIRLQPGVERLRLAGANLIGAEGTPAVRLNNQLLSITDADDEEIVVQLPLNAQSGILEIDLGGGDVLAYGLSFADDEMVYNAGQLLSSPAPEPEPQKQSYDDPWAPRMGK